MVTDPCGLACKYILVVLNIIMVVVGFASLGFGLWLRFGEITTGIFSTPLDSSAVETGVYVLIGLGSAMVVVGVFGEFSACKEKRWALQVSSILLFLLAVAEVLVGVLTYNHRDQIGTQLGDFYSSMYDLVVSDHNQPINVTLTFIHSRLNCCGRTGKPVNKDVCGQQTTPSPCPPIIENRFDSTASVVMAVFVGTGAALIIGVICSGVLGLLIFEYNPSSKLPAKHPLPTPQSKAENTYADPNVYSDPDGSGSNLYSHNYRDPGS